MFVCIIPVNNNFNLIAFFLKRYIFMIVCGDITCLPWLFYFTLVVFERRYVAFRVGICTVLFRPKFSNDGFWERQKFSSSQSEKIRVATTANSALPTGQPYHVRMQIYTAKFEMILFWDYLTYIVYAVLLLKCVLLCIIYPPEGGQTIRNNNTSI